MLMAAEAYHADPATWACTGVKNLRLVVLEEAGVVSWMPLSPIGRGSMASPWGARVTLPGHGLRLVRGTQAPAMFPGQASSVGISVHHSAKLMYNIKGPGE